MRMSSHERVRPDAVAVLVGCLVVTVVLIGCAAATPSVSSTPAPTATPPVATPTPDVTLIPTDPGTTPGPTPPGQTLTDWGPIWDGLPAGFPQFPGAHATETGQGPASATLDAGTAKPAEVVDFYRSALTAASYDVVSSTGPREDGSFELMLGGEAGCAMRITAAPLGGSTIVTIMYGVPCPFA